MKYMLLIHHGTSPLPGTDAWDALSEEERGRVYAGYSALNQFPGMTPGDQMAGADTATTVRVQDGRTLITDGPFAELKEAVGGYFLLEADDLDGAIAAAATVPSSRLGGGVEIRPLLDEGR
jgi:hypothetical protein